MSKKTFRTLGSILLVIMTILIIVHKKFYGEFQGLPWEPIVLDYIIVIIGITGFTFEIIAYFKNSPK